MIFELKFKDIAFELYLPPKLDFLTSKSFQLTQRIVQLGREKFNCKRKNSFLTKLKSTSHMNQLDQPHVSIHRLHIVYEKSQRLVLNKFFQLDLNFHSNAATSFKIDNYLKLKLIISYFDNFSRKLKLLLNEYVDEYDGQIRNHFNLKEFDFFQSCLGKIVD